MRAARDRIGAAAVVAVLAAAPAAHGGEPVAGAGVGGRSRGRCHEEYGAPSWTHIEKVPSAAAVTGVWVGEGRPQKVWTVADDGTIAGLGPFAKLFALHRAGRALRGIAGNRAGEVWAVGDGGIILKWKSPAPGAAWVDVPSGVSARLNAVFAPDPARRWAVGEQTTILRDDGSGWRRVVPPGIAGDLSLKAIWGTGVDELWVTSSTPALLHLRNGTWAKEETGAPGALLAIGGTAGDDVWAVGERGAVMHWDGRRWSATPEPVAGAATLRAVWARSRRQAWVVGDAGASLAWDGAHWTQVASRSNADLLAVAGTATEHFDLGVGADPDGKLTSVWAAGAAGTVLAFSQAKALLCPP
jgi:hypothetical protein